jgi:putative transmembrane protein
MESFMQYQTARAMRDAAKQEGGGAGLGAGLAFGNTIAQNVQDVSTPNNQAKGKIEQLRELKGLLDEGILTQEEFDAEKKRIIGN